MNEILDAEELFRLALHDSRDARHDGAIAKLKTALEKDPAHANAHFMLGAEYAEIGMFDRALETLQKAIELAPTLAAAHLQLGLVRYTMGDIALARAAWIPLDTLDVDGAMCKFKEGLLKMSEAKPVEALRLMKEGLSARNDNLALAKDMAGIVKTLEAHIVGVATAPEEPGHLFAHKYDDMARGHGGTDS